MAFVQMYYILTPTGMRVISDSSHWTAREWDLRESVEFCARNRQRAKCAEYWIPKVFGLRYCVVILTERTMGASASEAPIV